MKNKKQTILIILISVLIILGITAFVLTTTINKTKANTETGTEEGTSTGTGEVEEQGDRRVHIICDSCGYRIIKVPESCRMTPCTACGSSETHVYDATSSCGWVRCFCGKKIREFNHWFVSGICRHCGAPETTGGGEGHKTGCESYGNTIPCGETCPTCGAQSPNTSHTGGTHSNGGRCTVCDTRYQTHGKNTINPKYTRTSTTHTPLYSCKYEDCLGTYEGEAEVHSFSGTICTVCGYVRGSSADSGGHKTGCESYGNAIPCGETCPTCGAQSPNTSHTGGTHSNGGRCTVCGTRYQTHQKSTTIKEYHITSTTHTPIYACTFPDCTGTYDGTAEAHTYVGNECSVCNATKPSTGCTQHSYEQKYDATKHWEECTNCGAKKENSEGYHTGGELHNSGGRCDTCGYEYITHGQSTNFLGYESGNNGHCKTFACLAPNCNMVYRGKTESHTGGTHSNGGKCTVCNYIYQAHGQSTTVAGYDSTQTTHTPKYKCTYSGCTETILGTAEAHIITNYTSNGNETHTGTCTVCQYSLTEACTYDGNTCTKCGATEPNTGCVHNYITQYNETEHWEYCTKCKTELEGSRKKHTFGTPTSNGNGTHTKKCTVCSYSKTENCTYVNGKCSECGATEPNTGCVHNYITQYNETEHWEYCTKCKTELEGSRKNHIYGKILPNENGTHTKKCTGCSYSKTENCTYINGKCSECGANKPDTECSHTYKQRYNGVQHYEECTKCGAEKPGSRQNHTYGAATSNGKGTHSKKCTGCPYIRTEYCSYVNGKCSECGGEKPDTECTHNYVPKHNETEHWEECTICRIELEGSRQNHIYGKETSNGNGTHTKKCTVCSYSKTENCNYVNGKCSECGATKPDNENPGDGQDNTNNGQNNGNNTGNNTNNGNSNNGNSGGKPLPQTGTSSVVIIGIIAFTILGTLTFIRIKKYKLN